MAIGRRRIGGYANTWLRKFFVSAHEPHKVVHAFDPRVCYRGSDVVTIYDLIPFTPPYNRADTFSYWHKFVHDIHLKEVRFVQTISEFSKAEILRRYDIPRDRIVVTYPGVDHELFQPSKKVPVVFQTPKLKLLFVGANRPTRNVPALVEAMRYLPDVRLVLLGPQHDPKVSGQVDALRKTYSLDVVVEGYVPVSELPSYYSSADLSVMLSNIDGFGGLPNLEAMACGTSVVVTDIPVYREVLGDLPHYVPLHGKTIPDPKDVAETIQSAAENPRSHQELRGFCQRFTWREAAQSTLGIYQEVAKEKGLT